MWSKERERDQIKTQFWFTLGTCWLFSKPRRNQNHAAPVFLLRKSHQVFLNMAAQAKRRRIVKQDEGEHSDPAIKEGLAQISRKLAKFCRFLGQQSLIRSDLSYRGPGLTLATKGLTPASKGLTPATKGLTPATKGLTPATKGSLTPATKGSLALELRVWPLQSRVITSATKDLTPIRFGPCKSWPMQLRAWTQHPRAWLLYARAWQLGVEVARLTGASEEFTQSPAGLNCAIPPKLKFWFVCPTH